MKDYSTGVWDVSVMANLSDESIRDACERDAPTCVMVVEIQGGRNGPQADLHRSDECRLCEMIESFAESELGLAVFNSYA